MQDRNYDRLREMLSAHQGDGLEEKLKGLMADPTHRNKPNWEEEEEFIRSELEPKYVIVKNRGSYCFRARYTDMHRSLLSPDEIYNQRCDGGGFWGVDGENYRVMADFGMFNPLTRAVAEGYQEYAIAHLLRELGFRKESAWYIVKAKGMKPVKFKLNRNNFWRIEHHDFNGDDRFCPSMGQQWELPWGEMGTPYYQPFDHEGNLYTVPSLDQIHEFCCRRGFACYGIHEPQEIIRHLVFMYRTINNDPTAFRKYVERK